MNRKEFDSSFQIMCKALGVKVNKWQGELFWDEFKHKHPQDFFHACNQCGRLTPGKLPYNNVLEESVAAAMEMRVQKEKDDRESSIAKTHRVNFTPQERLEANRAAFEVMRQNQECKHTGKNAWSPIKVREASKDPSKDEEIREKYGDAWEPNPARVFGGLFQT